MKGFKLWGEKPQNGPFTHDSTGTNTSKCGTGTKRVLLGFAWLVPVPVRVVPVPVGYCHFFFLSFFFYETAMPIYRTFLNALHLGFHWMLISFPASYLIQPDLCSRN